MNEFSIFSGAAENELKMCSLYGKYFTFHVIHRDFSIKCNLSSYPRILVIKAKEGFPRETWFDFENVPWVSHPIVCRRKTLRVEWKRRFLLHLFHEILNNCLLRLDCHVVNCSINFEWKRYPLVIIKWKRMLANIKANRKLRRIIQRKIKTYLSYEQRILQTSKKKYETKKLKIKKEFKIQ